jgi:RNA polymerase sigma-70 factor, ECF subfamily
MIGVRVEPGDGVDEPALIEAARRGDADAWAALVRAHQEPLFRLAYLLLADPDEAEDAAQEALIRAHAALPGFEAGRALRPWLLRIVANTARNRLRSLRRSLAALQRAFRLTPESEPPPDAGASWEAETLWRAVRRLRHADQEVLYLRYFLDLSEAEAARALGVAQGTVKSRTSRALGRLRELIDREFPALRAERLGE